MAIAARPPPPPADMATIIAGILAGSLDIRSLWSIDHEPFETSIAPEHLKLLAFADRLTLQRLHKSPPPRSAHAELLVVIDGDLFESAWGPTPLTGSLARWAWRQSSPREAFYDQASWIAPGTDACAVVRVRRKALLVWQARDVGSVGRPLGKGV